MTTTRKKTDVKSTALKAGSKVGSKVASSKAVSSKTKAGGVKTVGKAGAKAVAKKVGVKKVAAKKDVAKKDVVKKVGAKTAVKAVATKVVTKAATKVGAKKDVVKKSDAPKTVAKKLEVTDFSEKMRDIALRILDERQAEDVAVFDLRDRSSIADFAIIASGRSGRQLVAITEYLREAFFKAGVRKLRIEGVEQADWVLFDGGDVIIHLFRPEVRSYYNLEEIWATRTPPNPLRTGGG